MLNHIAAPHMSHLPGSNGFGADFNGANGAVNNLMNILAMPNMDPTLFLPSGMKSVPGRFAPETWNSNPMHHVQQQQQQQLQAQQQQAQAMASQQQQQQQQQHQQSSVKQEKIMLTPKPIEELLMNPNDKKSMSGSAGAPPSFAFNSSKYEQQNLKNASSWSQLAAAGSPQNPGVSISSSKSKVPSDTFQEYKTKAKEQQQRIKQEQEKKMRKEQELKKQQESLQKQKSEDMSNGHRFVELILFDEAFK
jgi:hypothetical protein